jgi:transposase, IS30 family
MYSRLTQGERYQVQALNTSGLGVREISRQLGRNPSTISREIRRRPGPYDAALSQLFADAWRQRSPYKIRGRTESYVRQKLLLDWSPEQISGRILLERLRPVSYSTIYRYVEAEKAKGGLLWKHLRILRRARKDRKSPKWHPKLHMPDRIMITERPVVVETRQRLGDFERDTVIGKADGPLLLTIVDRTSRLMKLAWLERKTSDLVHKATVRALRNEPVKTITNDNGTEFARHQKTSKALNAQIYFSHAFRSWERGSNENLNGLVRQYFPRRTSVGKYDPKQIRRVEHLLNTRPRKCLGFRTPLEIHAQLKSSGVALAV